MIEIPLTKERLFRLFNHPVKQYHAENAGW